LWRDPHESTFALIVAAVKLGRRLLRNQDIPHARDLLHRWIEAVSSKAVQSTQSQRPPLL
jgi:hypothetical protein